MLKRSGAYTLVTLFLTLAITLAGAAGMTLFARFASGGAGETTVIEDHARALNPLSFSIDGRDLSFPLLEGYDVNACVTFWDYTDTKRTENPAVYENRKKETQFRPGLYNPYGSILEVARLIIELAGYRSANTMEGDTSKLELALADRVQIDPGTKTLYLQDFTFEQDGALYSVDLICDIKKPTGLREADGEVDDRFYFKCTPKNEVQGEQPSTMWKQQRFSQLCDGFYQDMKAGEKFKLDFSHPRYGIIEKLKVENNPLSAFFLVFHSNFSDMLERVTGGQLQAAQSHIVREPSCAPIAGDGLHYYVQQWEESESTLVLMYNPVSDRVEGVSIS